MKEKLQKLGKLRGRSFDELRVRGAQAVAAYSERLGLRQQSQLPSDDELLRLLDADDVAPLNRSALDLRDAFRKRRAPGFFASFADLVATRRILRDRFGDDAKLNLLAKADRIVDGRFDLLGFHDLKFGDPIDWHLEPLSGRRSPLLHWSHIDELDATQSGDKKIVWELNRHQYFVVLGRAYVRTADERYASTFAAHLAGWMESNPPKLGLNWTSSLEVAYRAISWIWATNYFIDSLQMTPRLFADTMKFLYLHATHLETFLSIYSSPNTHLTGEALGLFYLGTMLPEFRRAARWREVGSAILLEALERQVMPDGVYFEQATYYHRYTADFYIHFLLLRRLMDRSNDDADGATSNRKLETKLEALLDHMMYVTRPDGTTPFIGDDDGGRLLMLDDAKSNDFRSTLATGAAIFGRADYKFVAGDVTEETLWLMGPDAIRSYDELGSEAPQSASRAFPNGGYYVMRDGWNSGANFLLIDCGPHGFFNCGHAHADALSFDLAARGRTLLVDPGTFAYTGSAEMRDYFRSSAAHNALTIDGESSSASAGPFSWKHIASSSVKKWVSRQRFDYFSGEHDGYTRLSSPARHERSVLFIKNDYWIVRDRVETSGTHHYDLNFHLAPDANVATRNEEAHTQKNRPGTVRITEADAPIMELFTFAGDGSWHIEDGWVSDCYGARKPAPVCIFSEEGAGSKEFFTLIMPVAQSTAIEAIELNARGGRAFELKRQNLIDIQLARSEESIESNAPIEAESFVSDFDWAWIRLSADEVIEELVLVGGRTFSMHGRQIVNLPEATEYVVARRVGNALHLETDSEQWEVPLPIREAEVVSASSDQAVELQDHHVWN